MRYTSTRSSENKITAAQAVVRGLATDGGLFVPECIPALRAETMLGLSYPEIAAKVMGKWLDDFGEDALLPMCKAAYSRFDTEKVVPVTELSCGRNVLELWHGPTLAFKDVALTMLPHLMRFAAQKTGEKREICILVATSGDTGKAALEGFKDVEGTRICVFYPHGGVSKAQYMQMATQEGKNTSVIAVQGNFDDAQTGVKKLFADRALGQKLSEKNIVLSSANSINLGRLVPQIAYYFHGYLALVQKGDIQMDDKINICVPTGNFGNILAAYYAKMMGLPVDKLICASNSNNVLADFITKGTYDKRRSFHITTSPSMDILISSNLERFLYEMTEHDCDKVRGMMTSLGKEGFYTLEGSAFAKMRETLYGNWASEEEVSEEIRRVFDAEQYLIDPHTAVAFTVLDKYRAETGDDKPCLIASTASPFKFGRAMADALLENAKELPDDFACCEKVAELAGVSVPKAISYLPKKPILHTVVCEKDAMESALLDTIK